MTNVICLISKDCFGHQTIIHCSCPNHEPWGFRLEKNRIPALDTWGEYQSMISMSPDSCIFPDIEKHWTWDIWFSLTVIFWTSDYLVFVARTPIYSGSSSTSSEQSLRDIWETVSPTSVLSFVCWIKDYSQLLGCAFHFQLTRIDYEVQTSSYKRKVTGM